MIWKIVLKHLSIRPVSTAITLVSICLAMSFLGIYWTLMENLEKVRIEKSSASHSEPDLSIFISTKLSQQEIKKLRREIIGHEFIKEANVISPEQTLENLKGEFGDTVSNHLNLEQLPLSLKISFKKDTYTKDQLLLFFDELKSKKGVLDFDSNLYSINHWGGSDALKGISQWANLLFAIVFLVCALLVSYLIRLTFEANRGDIENLKTLGASNLWIFWPLLIESLFYGVAGALFALATIEIFTKVLIPKVTEFLLPSSFEVFSLSPSASINILLVALGASLFGSLISYPLVRKKSEAI